MNFSKRPTGDESKESGGIKFDSTIRISDVLVVVSGIASILYVWASLDKRVALLEQNSTSTQAVVQEVRADVKKILEQGVVRDHRADK